MPNSETGEGREAGGLPTSETGEEGRLGVLPNSETGRGREALALAQQ